MLKVGFTKKYYTLWNVQVEEPTEDSYGKTHFMYIQNLSFDKKAALEKAKALGCEILEVDDDLYGKNGSFTVSNYTKPEINPNYLHFGKYKEVPFSEITDLDYLVWASTYGDFYGGDYNLIDEYEELVENLNARIGELNDGTYTFYYDHNYDKEMWLKTAYVNKELLIKEVFKQVEEEGTLTFTPYSNINAYGFLKATVEVGDVEIDVELETEFPVKQMYYNGYEYFVPMQPSGAGMRFKDKTCISSAYVGKCPERKDFDIIILKDIKVVK